MNSAVLAFLTCLLVFYAQGQPANRSSKCKCLNGYIDWIKPQLIKAGPVIHPPSIFCQNEEIIITTIANKEKCVNPKSSLGRHILKSRNRFVKNISVSTTTSSSTSLHTTSRLLASTPDLKTMD
ncbi:C-X-C motif chemokine 11-6-like [Chelmon rostratus]|uniref:C-X-C motif chemokine 11-6-like n=1 Tax=Chelmon rostratus TaxID=109905 RepID=UPI001BE577A9|nr:C-X-C motif chemokine 11-6-like [Chelmon rostratus]